MWVIPKPSASIHAPTAEELKSAVAPSSMNVSPIIGTTRTEWSPAVTIAVP